jgi:hypothetical protein
LPGGSRGLGDVYKRQPVILGKPSWDKAVYDAVYKAYPPLRWGCEIYDWESPHIQLRGGQNAARALGIAANRVQDGKNGR